MIDIDSYRQNAAECVRQAQGEDAPEDRNLLLNVALAWLRLAHQTESLNAQAMDAQAMGDQAVGDQAVDLPAIADLDGTSAPAGQHEMA